MHIQLYCTITIPSILVSLFQFKQAEECYQELLKNKSSLEHDIKIKRNSLFIDSQLCLESRKIFPVAAKLQPNSELFNKVRLEMVESHLNGSKINVDCNWS